MTKRKDFYPSNARRKWLAIGVGPVACVWMDVRRARSEINGQHPHVKVYANGQSFVGPPRAARLRTMARLAHDFAMARSSPAVRPHAQYAHHPFLRKNLVDQAVVDIEPSGVGTREIANQFLESWGCLKRVGLLNGQQFLCVGF